MSFNTEMNKWAPKLTIVFQLTIWSIVGIILLQKGTISLYENVKPRNNSYITQEKVVKWNEKELIGKSNILENHPQIGKFPITTQEQDISIDTSDSVSSGRIWPLKSQGSYRSTNSDGEAFSAIPKFKKRTTIRHIDIARDARSIQTPTVYATNQSLVEGVSRKENVVITLTTKVRFYDERSLMLNNTSSAISFELKNSTPATFVTLGEDNLLEQEQNEVPYRSTETNKNDRKLHSSPVNRIGAAVAIIMLAIGIVMLLLGPLIVIVRAISNRRRTTKMLKSRRCADQPPSYEEATLMDQAPRYSTLQLDTNLDTLLSL